MATSRLRKVAYSTAVLGAGALAASWLTTELTQPQRVSAAELSGKKLRAKRTLPPRDEQIKSLQTEDEFDVLIIGGGATGAGCALDSVTRGLKTALVEMDDFASGTSSRSTKLIHGGVRYLQKAIFNLDIDQYRMVKEALHERTNMLESAPHLTHPLPIMLPVYTWWQIPYYWVGIKMYDLVAGSKSVKSSYYLSKKDALELFPMLRGDKLCGAIVYYDGQQDDARMCLAIALTATRHGATVANHVKVQKLIHGIGADGKKEVQGASLRDELTGKEWDVKAKCVINATGPFTDSIRKMDNQNVKEICCPSSGVHIVLPGYYSPDQMGLLDPDTSDGRVIFFLPWQRQTIAGTTDRLCDVTHNPIPTEDEIEFILNEVKHYLNPDVEVRRGDVLSAWSGIRPLVSDPNKEDTQSLARNHIVHVSDTKMITIAGGKWTTYRAMAEHTIDAAIKACNLKPTKPECQTDGLLIEGAHGWTPTMYIRLVQDFGLECEVAQHLAMSYGDRAFAVAKLASLTGKRFPIIGKRIHPEFPYIDAEIRYGVREYACSAVDMIARRLRLAFLNNQAAQEALPTVIDIMAEELKWSEKEKKVQYEKAVQFLAEQMGQQVNRASREKMSINLSKDEMQLYIKRFQMIDKDHKGYVSINDIRRSMKSFGEEVSGEELHEILKEIDTNMNGQVELDEYLQMMSAIKSGAVAYSRFARMAEMQEAAVEKEGLMKKVSVERSGGGDEYLQ
ncbi:glycerol-3-phosphate dehydrogenase, mitochondrial isoform X1 [Frankliniella occidentalis]|uniref:Glycerol-3-phosphate dehydrogenase n=1 Tax=Frankliniella occidentalis TaxID=133901 RepID=A0A9C6U246_FRAOC|nr:glycerol-3-phosphate dehydrogenase, mitochondrial isoform X1 [Frankliniella occidentalis]XP_052120232.1 glycerol-3-phosphate dehydrogenase, mitochondrial isoform X1 [Frankliniella occidentalis]XP_052120233.1 glycerol-3-phosphate dehydrogenase, mitochondrial isoform X1 [Frankliniella occidentalis]XP_052120234.1 glycerol-3-phosphate dehydrogenase, mitochondrial isoform X1 [Frankliniella occidentalis]XP_052120235.1 glycerol-3-phosphate dehydrogenase, mitochondrial isoform X1 [Frankliniella occi